MKNKKEIDDLNIWIASNIFGEKILTVEQMRGVAEDVWKTQPACTSFMMGFTAWMDGEKFHCEQQIDDYARNPKYNSKLLDWILDSDMEVVISKHSGKFHVSRAEHMRFKVSVSAPTRELAICLFAQALKTFKIVKK